MKPAQKKQRINPHCPVPGCKTLQPHADDPIVKAMIIEFAPPEKMVFWVRAAIAELGRSIERDLAAGHYFAWHTRMRQPEELYIRTLYALFIADEKELHHILSGAMPNGFSGYYKAVNEHVFEGRGMLQADLQGLNKELFKPMETLNDGAHASFRSFLTVLGWKLNPEYMPAAEKYTKHLVTYCRYLDYMEGMFKAGKEKKHVLEGVKNLHKPAAHWNAKQAKAAV